MLLEIEAHVNTFLEVALIFCNARPVHPQTLPGSAAACDMKGAYAEVAY